MFPGDLPSPVHPKMHTPNIDKLAARSLLLKRRMYNKLCALQVELPYSQEEDQIQLMCTILSLISGRQVAILPPFQSILNKMDILQLEWEKYFILELLLVMMIHHPGQNPISRTKSALLG